MKLKNGWDAPFYSVAGVMDTLLKVWSIYPYNAPHGHECVHYIACSCESGTPLAPAELRRFPELVRAGLVSSDGTWTDEVRQVVLSAYDFGGLALTSPFASQTDTDRHAARHQFLTALDHEDKFEQMAEAAKKPFESLKNKPQGGAGGGRT